MFEFESFNSDKKIQLENCPLCNSEDLSVSHIGNERTQKRSIEIKCKNCRINIKDSAMRYGFDWLESLASSNWNNRQSRNDGLEQLVKRQAPCTDYCEAAAFSITIKNLKSANVELEARVKVLSEALTKTTDELDSWWKDQGDYGTEGYSKWIPELRELINQSQ